MPSYIVVIMTTASRDEALKIVRSLPEDRLIACANIVGPVSSRNHCASYNKGFTVLPEMAWRFPSLSERLWLKNQLNAPNV